MVPSLVNCTVPGRLHRAEIGPVPPAPEDVEEEAPEPDELLPLLVQATRRGSAEERKASLRMGSA
jgi:hypothetical protein